jgi:hypothetical protein
MAGQDAGHPRPFSYKQRRLSTRPAEPHCSSARASARSRLRPAILGLQRLSAPTRK